MPIWPISCSQIGAEATVLRPGLRPVQRKVCEVSESHAAALGINLAVCGITANHLRNFDVEQMRRVQRPGRIEQPLLSRACGRRAKKYFEHSRGRIVIYIT
ncbi:hypothetical protein KMZ29_21505 [Bradyrhizobium sediminis]|uniref:Uncharacterized protein n=1 Tax=Bradyrhizobium sediminis TaxID=2840469 RepID=A0A975NBX2_9BRAD|nr:hypothetical protein [Bradyrhizobium sediminis]QWG12262.1 hypothetical protein KMZ29_21505 [Bradyrhizobium sediminis]